MYKALKRSLTSTEFINIPEYTGPSRNSDTRLFLSLHSKTNPPNFAWNKWSGNTQQSRDSYSEHTYFTWVDNVYQLFYVYYGNVVE